MNVITDVYTEQAYLQHFREMHELQVHRAGFGFLAAHRFMHRYGTPGVPHEHMETDRKRGWIPWQFSSKAMRDG